MKKIEIDQLLKKYWDAESTLEEERTLSTYFTDGDVDPSHEQYAPLFNFYVVEREQITTDLDIDKIDFEVKDKRNGYGHFRLSPFKMGIAASFILTLAYLGGLNISDQHAMGDSMASNVVIYDEDKEMQEAYEVTKEALSILSSKLKSSQKTVSENLQEIKKVDLRN